MEPEGSLPHSQELSTCPCAEPDQSVHTTQSYLSKIHLNIITHLLLGLRSGSFLFAFPPVKTDFLNLIYI
jgi:hypothetical protein